MSEQGLWVLLISVIVPAIIAKGLPLLSSRMKARQAARLSDAEFGTQLRDELWARLRELEDAERECQEDRERLHKDIAQLRYELMELKQRVREGTSGPAQIKRLYDEEAAG